MIYNINIPIKHDVSWSDFTNSCPQEDIPKVTLYLTKQSVEILRSHPDFVYFRTNSGDSGLERFFGVDMVITIEDGEERLEIE